MLDRAQLKFGRGNQAVVATSEVFQYHSGAPASAGAASQLHTALTPAACACWLCAPGQVLRRPFFTELQSRYGNLFYVREQASQIFYLK